MKNMFIKTLSSILNTASLAVLTILLAATSVFGASPEQRSDVNSNAAFRDENSSARGSCSSLTSPSGAVASDLNLGSTADERQVAIMGLLIDDFGLSPEQAAGVVGNMTHESGTQEILPNVNQGGVVGPPSPIDTGGHAYGWVQWDGGRKTAFLQFAIDQGYMISREVSATDAANYAYLVHELTETSEKDVLINLSKAQTAEEAARVWVDEFERAGTVAYDERIKSANEALDKFNGGGSVGSTTGGGCVNGSASIVGDFAFPLIINKSGIPNANSIFGNGVAKGNHPYSDLVYDIYAPDGTPVVSSVSGKVTKLGKDKCPGRAIHIYSEENDALFWYAHLQFNTEEIEVGDTVTAGQVIGYSGGEAEGCGTPHLHFDVSTGNTKPGCKRESCPQSSRDKFVDVGPRLLETFQGLPD